MRRTGDRAAPRVVSYNPLSRLSKKRKHMRNPEYRAQRCHRLLFGVLAWTGFAMGPWDKPQAQTGRCTGTDMMCLEEDRDTHIGSCSRLSYKHISLAGREPDNMRAGWYMYSHRCGGLLPLDAPDWRPVVEQLELLRDAKGPSDEVDACLLDGFWLCLAITFKDLEICAAEEYLKRVPDECDVTLAKAQLSDGVPAKWYGMHPEVEGVVPLIVREADQTWPQRVASAYGRYGGAREVLRWLELADAVGANPVNICALKSAYECYTEGDHAGDASTCMAPLVDAGARSRVP